MISGLICVGDRTTHGGTVITGDAISIIGNRAMARAGDMTICPKCKGTFPILAGNGIINAPNGVPYARHMDRTACGARLLASQDTTLASDMETPFAAEFDTAGRLTSAAREVLVAQSTRMLAADRALFPYYALRLAGRAAPRVRRPVCASAR